jgi:homoserine dehydrogenase
VMNAILVMADKLGPSLYYGPGAGADPTASAVVADIIDVVRTITTDAENRVPHLAFQPEHIVDIPILPIGEATTAYYLRMRADDKPGVLADITRIMGESGISIEAILQKEPKPGITQATIIMMTQTIREKQMDQALAKIAVLSSVNDKIHRIRVETLDAS